MSQEQHHVLLVEDDLATQKSFARLLHKAGIEVQTADTVANAIKLLANLPALVLLDLRLPDGSGVEVLAEIRRLGLRCKVAIVSGAKDPSLFLEAQKYKPDAVFGKPLDFEDFIDWMCQESPGAMGSPAAAGVAGG